MTMQAFGLSCQGGLNTNLNQFQMLQQPGFATELQNFEVDPDGGYRRINGYSKYVDAVVVQDCLVDTKQLTDMKIDVIALGSDWEHKSLYGVEWFKKNGGRVVYFPYTTEISSTKIKKIIKERK